MPELPEWVKRHKKEGIAIEERNERYYAAHWCKGIYIPSHIYILYTKCIQKTTGVIKMLLAMLIWRKNEKGGEIW